MGCMTCVTILTDGWDCIKQHPDQFLENIEHGMSAYMGPSVKSFPVGYHANPMCVKRAEHADFMQLVMLSQNATVDLLERPDILLQSPHTLDYHHQCLCNAQKQIEKQLNDVCAATAYACLIQLYNQHDKSDIDAAINANDPKQLIALLSETTFGREFETNTALRDVVVANLKFARDTFSASYATRYDAQRIEQLYRKDNP